MHFRRAATSRSGLWRTFRSLATVAGSLLFITCADNPSGPSRPGLAAVALQPAFDQYALFAPVTLNRVRVIAVRAPGDTALDQSRNFGANETQLRLSLQVPLQAARETMEVTLQLLSGSTLLFEGRDSMEIGVGSNGPAVSIPVTYSGPGANATALQLAPVDTVVPVGATVAMGAIALNGQGQDVGQFYLHWSLIGADPSASIDAAGILRASNVADTLFVLGITPNGLRDSVQLTARVAPTASTITKVQGDNQVGNVGETLEVPLVVQVTGTGGASIPGVTVSFTATSGGGQVESASTTTDSEGFAQSGATLGQTVGAQTFTASAPGLTPVVFTATAIGAGGTTRTWTGATSTDFSVASNWSGGVVPGAADDVVIGAATNQPSLTAASTVHDLTINTGGQLTANNQVMVVTGNLTTAGTGVVVMTQANDGIAVLGNAVFGGGSESGLLTNGVFQLSGNFSQTGGTSPLSFRSTSEHISSLIGTAQTVSFASPGASTSGFNRLVLNSGSASSVTLATSVFAFRDLTVGSNGGTTVTTANGSGLTTGALTLTTPLTFNGVPLTVDRTTTGGLISLAGAGSITFQNMAPTVSQLTIRHPGDATPLGLSNLTFSTVPTTGFYLDVTDNNTGDANALVVNVTSTTPASGGAFVRTTSATVNWPVAGGNTRTWTGITNTAFATASNWSPASVPTATSDVIIPAGTANNLVMTVNNTIQSLTVNAGGTMSVGSTTTNVNGSVLNDGAITGTGTVQILGTGSIRGALPAVTIGAAVNQVGRVTVTGNLNISTGGNYAPLGHTTIVSGALVTLNGGAINMSNAIDTIRALNVNLSGTGSYAAGLIQVQQNFSQTGAGTAFQASGTHTVQFLGSGTIALADPVNARFQNLDASFAGVLTLNQDVSAGNLVSLPPATPARILGGGAKRSLTVGGLQVSGLTLDNTALITNSNGITQFDNVTIQNLIAGDALVVNDSGAATAYTFNNINFTALPAGNYLVANDLAPADANILTITMASPTPADPSGKTSALNGSVINWPAAVSATWTGATSTNWSVAGNWTPAAIPGPTADVIIGAGTNQPTLTADVTVKSVRITTATGRLTIGGHTLTTSGNLTTDTDGVLIMTNAADRVIVNGDATFQGGNTTGLLTAGELRLARDFNVGQQTVATAFVASGTHKTVMTNAGAFQTVTICCTAGVSHFQNLDMSNSFGINIQFSGNGVLVSDTLIVQPGAGQRPWLYMLGSPLTARRFRVDKLLVDRGTLTLNENGVLGNQQLDNVTFQNYQTTQTQLAVTAVGGRTLDFNNLTFMDLSAGNTGRYINATSSAGALIVNLPGGLPVNGPSFTTAGGGVTVNWPAPTSTWTGAVSTAWETPGNWSTGVVPTATADVIIPSGTPNAPTAGTVVSNVRNLTVNSGATLTLVSPNGLTAAGNVNAIGTIAGTANLSMTAASTLQGNVGPLNLSGVITLSGAVTAGTVNVTGASAELLLNGFTIQGSGWAFQNGARLGMTNPNDSLVATGSMTFAGGSTLGRLTAGVIELRGGLAQVSTGSTTSFASTGTRVRATGSNQSTFNFQSGGAALSRFFDLIIDKPAGLITLLTKIYTNTTFVDGGTLVVGGQAVTTAAGFAVQNAGLLQMTNANDSVIVGGNAFFTTSGDETGRLTAGVLRVAASMTQAGNATSFVATGTHKTLFTNSLTSTYNFASAGAAGSRFQNVEITGNGAVLFTQGAFVSGTMTVTGAPNLNANGTLNVRGLLTTSAGAGLGLDTLILGNATPIAPGSGFINTRAMVLDGVVAQTVPLIPTPSGPDSTTLILFSDATLTSRAILKGLLINGSGRLTFNGQALDVRGPVTTTALGTFRMTNALDSLITTGVASFNGGSTDGLLTAGVMTFANDFHQSAVNSTTSFAPSGTHKTRFITSALRQLDFGSPGSASGGSHFQDLDLSGATSGVQLTVNSIVDGTLTSSGSGRLNGGGGSSLTARQFALSGFIVDDARLILNEQGTAVVQAMNNVTFQNLTAPGGLPLFDIVAVGTSVTPRILNFTSISFPVLAAGEQYVRLDSSNDQSLTLNITSNRTAGGVGAANSTPPNGTTVAGATIVWQ